MSMSSEADIQTVIETIDAAINARFQLSQLLDAVAADKNQVLLRFRQLFVVVVVVVVVTTRSLFVVVPSGVCLNADWRNAAVSRLSRHVLGWPVKTGRNADHGWAEYWLGAMPIIPIMRDHGPFDIK